MTMSSVNRDCWNDLSVNIKEVAMRMTFDFTNLHFQTVHNAETPHDGYKTKTDKLIVSSHGPWTLVTTICSMVLSEMN